MGITKTQPSKPTPCSDPQSEEPSLLLVAESNDGHENTQRGDDGDEIDEEENSVEDKPRRLPLLRHALSPVLLLQPFLVAPDKVHQLRQVVVDERQLVHLLVPASRPVDVHQDLRGGPRVTGPLAAAVVPVDPQEASALLLRQSAGRAPAPGTPDAALAAIAFHVGPHQVVHAQQAPEEAKQNLQREHTFICIITWSQGYEFSDMVL